MKRFVLPGVAVAVRRAGAVPDFGSLRGRQVGPESSTFGFDPGPVGTGTEPGAAPRASPAAGHDIECRKSRRFMIN